MKIFLHHQRYEALILNQRLDKDRWSSPSGCYILATVSCLHRNKYCMEQLTSPCRILVRYCITPQHHGNMYADGYWMQIRAKARHSATTVVVQWEGKWVSNTNTHTHRQTTEHTHTCLSSFWAVFQCAISSAERPQSCLWNLAFMTAWSVPYSNYRWQHACTQTYMHTNLHAHTRTHTHGKSRVKTELNIGDLLHTHMHVNSSS